MSDEVTGLYALPLEPAAPLRELHVGYPDGYRDPPWDGSEAGWRDVVLPARLAALRESFNGALAELGLPDLRLDWQPLSHAGVLGYDLVMPKPWPVTTEGWTPFRDVLRRSPCYRLPSGSAVHFKPSCRCPR